MATLDIVRQVLYIIFGTTCLLCNVFLIFLIARCKELHFNAHYLTAALAATDVLMGLAFAATGAYRLDLFLRNETDRLITPGECILVPSTTLFALAYHSQSIVIMVIAADRLLAVSAVKFYFDLGKAYTSWLVGFCILYTSVFFVCWAYDLTRVVPQLPSVTKFCWDINSPTVHAYDYYGPLVLVSTSVVLMIVTLCVLRYRNRSQTVGGSHHRTSAADSSNDARAISVDRNAKAARLLAVISFKTFSMWVLPEAIVQIIESTMYGYESDGWFARFAPFLWMLQPIHGVTNLMIYFRKGSQMRTAYAQMKSRVNQAWSTVGK